MDIIDLLPLSDDDKFPVIRNLWDFFASKGNRTVFVSVGTSSTPTVELHFSEALGCKVFLFDEDVAKLEKWDQVKQALKTRKVSDDASDFVKSSIKKWVLPNNLFVQSPETTLTFSTTQQVIKNISSYVGEERIDAMKFDCSTKKMAEILYATLHCGYRPGVLMIHWETSPDSTLETTLLAGHLQNVGYGLACKWNNNYLYIYMDKNVYELCSWETTAVPNPLVAKILESFATKNQEKE